MPRTLGGFAIDDKVLFGRGQGEKTRGTVVGIGRTKLKVRQDEARGTHRDYPIGSVWTVPPSLCTKLSAGSEAPSTKPTRPSGLSPREVLASKGIGKGDRVEFIVRGQTYTGTIERINTKRVTIMSVSGGRFPNGVYCPPSAITRKADGPAPAATGPVYAVGDRIVFGLVYGGEQEATVTKVKSNGTCEVYSEGMWFPRTVRPLRKVGRRNDPEAARAELDRVLNTLDSPEIIYSDGEVSRTVARSRVAALNRARRVLEREVGR